MDRTRSCWSCETYGAEEEKRRNGDVSLNACTAAAQHNKLPTVEYRIFTLAVVSRVDAGYVQGSCQPSLDSPKCNIELRDD
jgi:hypothetical protein